MFSHYCHLPGGPRTRPVGATAQVADRINNLGQDQDPQTAEGGINATETARVMVRY